MWEFPAFDVSLSWKECYVAFLDTLIWGIQYEKKILLYNCLFPFSEQEILTNLFPVSRACLVLIYTSRVFSPDVLNGFLSQ